MALNDYHDDWDKSMNHPDYYMGLDDAFTATLAKVDELLENGGNLTDLRVSIMRCEIKPTKDCSGVDID